jgi:hypothetical protein
VKIQARQLDGGLFALQFDGTEVRLGSADLKSLLLQVTRLLIPNVAEGGAGERLLALIARLQDAPDVSVQAFLRRADHADVVVLLKSGEAAPERLDKLFRNMSERSRKMCLEDVAFMFPDDLPPQRANSSALRLAALVRALEGEGRMPPGS